MLLILSALKDEIKPLLEEMEIKEKVILRPSVIFRGEHNGKDVIIGHTGIGLAKMYRAASFCMKEYKPSTCINIGYCGALTPHLSLASLVIAEAVIDSKDDRVYQMGTAETEKAKDICSSLGLSFQTGPMLTTDRVVKTPHEKAFLGTKYSAIAVDMESAGLAQASMENNVPCTIIRSVLDPMDIHLPDFTGVVSDNGSTSFYNLAVNITMRPQNVISLPQLHYCAESARDSIMRFAHEFLKK